MGAVVQLESRRGFLKSAGVGAAAAAGSYFVGNRALGQESYRWANEQPVVAFIGTGIRFHTSLGRGATEFGPCAAVCDVDIVQAGRALQVVYDQHRKKGWPIATAVSQDYRAVLDRDDVDVVVIGSPDHWHTKQAIDAMRAGKDVYCEKPLTLTIREGRQIEKVMAETGKVVQVGTQQRTEFGQQFATAAAMVRDGRCGKMERVTAAIGGCPSSDPLPVRPVPGNLNWDLWLGQAPFSEYRQGPLIDTTGWGAGHPHSRTHRYYRWWYEYSGGIVTDWGAHHVDISFWALDLLSADAGRMVIDPVEVHHPVPMKEGMPTRDDQFNTATSFNVNFTLPGGIEFRLRNSAESDLGFRNGIMFEGSEGRFLVNRGKLVGRPVEDLASNPLPAGAIEKLYGGPIPPSHMGNFMECVKTRRQPISDVPSHNRAMAVCHVANIAMRLGRKLTYDPQTESFVDDKQADGFLAREQRKGYEIDA